MSTQKQLKVRLKDASQKALLEGDRFALSGPLHERQDVLRAAFTNFRFSPMREGIAPAHADGHFRALGLRTVAR